MMCIKTKSFSKFPTLDTTNLVKVVLSDLEKKIIKLLKGVSFLLVCFFLAKT